MPGPGFTERHVKEALRLWPQAVSMDEGDLKRLREICDSGSKGGTTPSLRWADYLWLDLVENLSKAEPKVESISEAVMTDTRGDGSSLSFRETSESPLPPLPTGHHPYSIALDHIGGVVELKIMETDLHEKLAATHMRGGRWSKQALRTLAKHLQEKLREAHKQIRDTKRLLGCGEALGFVILIETKTVLLPSTVVLGYIRPTIEPLDCIDAVLYLSNNSDGSARSANFCMKDPANPAVRRLHGCFNTLFQAVRADADGNIILFGTHPYIMAQVNVDASVREAFARNWEEALRLGHGSHITVRFQERSRFQPGISA